MSRPIRLLCLMALAGLPAAHAGKPPFDPLNSPVPVAKPEPKPAAAVPAAPTASTKPAPAPTPVATPTAAAAAKPAFDPLHPAGPRVIAFDELENYVGKSVVIRTSMRTTRKGTLKRFNRAGLVIEDVSRGFSMDIDIPRSTVAEVQVRD